MAATMRHSRRIIIQNADGWQSIRITRAPLNKRSLSRILRGIASPALFFTLQLFPIRIEILE
jgi:hypothetical protein